MKNCLLVIRNKKLPFTGVEIESLCSPLSACGYFFDRIICVGYDSHEEITRAIRECKDGYANLVISCPIAMKVAISDYVGKLYGDRFDMFGIMNCAQGLVFLYEADVKGALTPEKIIDSLNARYGSEKYVSYIKTVGAPSKLIGLIIEAAAKIHSDLQFRVYGNYDDLTIEIIYSPTTPKVAVDSAVRLFVSRLDEYIYALEDISLTERLFQILKLRRMKISVAESFTGGGVSKRLVELSGISEVFQEGLNTYSNVSKMVRLGVKDLTLKQYGAVSGQTACEMAQGLIASGNCDISIATTGIAGPKSDNTNKPVGLCYIAIGFKDNVSVYQFNLNGDRKVITETAINHALFLAYKSLK